MKLSKVLLQGKRILVTGGTGFLGPALIERLLNEYEPKFVRVLARNEGKLIECNQKFQSRIEPFAGDISDPFVCEEVLQDVAVVFHLAAFKHVGMAEKQTYQCVQSNIVGTWNLLRRFTSGTFLAISTDKAARISGVYGASKMCMEKLIQEVAQTRTWMNYRIVRYGNVLYSTGSVACKWKAALKTGHPVTITDPEATRYFWTVDQAVDLIFECLDVARGATPYCPEMKSMRMGDLLEAMQRKYGRAVNVNEIGLQPGENKHELILAGGKSSDAVQHYTVDEIVEMI
jgi:UDP-N-acetylglucosamine 4,6-dehydratase/5-epimerase